MQYVFKPALPVTSLVMVTLLAAGLVLSGDDSLALSSGARLFFLILAPLAIYHLSRIASSFQFFELTPHGIAVQGLFRRKTLAYGAIERATFSPLTGAFLLKGSGIRLAIPASTHRFGDLQFAILTGVWAHQGQDKYELVVAPQIRQAVGLIYQLKPHLTERLHAAYAVAAPVIWAGCLGLAAGPSWSGGMPLLLLGGLLQTAMNFHSLRHLLNWYELRADGLVIHSLLSRQFLPSGEFLTSIVREEGRSLELAFMKQTVQIRFGFRMPTGELAGMLNQRWTAQASY